MTATLEQLFKRFKSLTPKQRLERIQAHYFAILEANIKSGKFSEATERVHRAAMNTVDRSIRFHEIEQETDDDTF